MKMEHAYYLIQFFNGAWLAFIALYAYGHFQQKLRARIRREVLWGFKNGVR